ncbi:MULTISPECIES: hypothetical protein [unclassified Thiocapsa]|uniref:hypothetical protein n=1 Tax=unclassified Thiocapsa TaxID=2641286 RepID=UPI0035B1B0E1
MLERQYPRTKNDLYAAFVERGIGVLGADGMIGANTSRTGFLLLAPEMAGGIIAQAGEANRLCCSRLRSAGHGDGRNGSLLPDESRSVTVHHTSVLLADQRASVHDDPGSLHHERTC